MKTYCVVSYGDAMTGYKPAILFKLQARDLDHAKEKLPILFRSLGDNEHLVSYQDYLSDNRLTKEMISGK